jgi:hypothetical protein
MLALAAAPAHADPCQQVRFQISNLTWAKVRLSAIETYGSGGSRREDLDQRIISSHGSTTTAARDLANIEDGGRGNFTVIYDTVPLAAGRWTTDPRQGFIDLPCHDGKTFTLELTNRG